MNKRTFNRIMSLVLIMVMAVSTMMVAAVSTSAETANAVYNFDFQTASNYGKSNNKISIKVNGENGSTSWHNVGKVANEKKDNCHFTDINVGAIKSITVKNNGSDGWYPEIIDVTVGKTITTIYGGRWIDDEKEVTLSVTDRAAKVTVKTGDILYAGTDGAVYMNLIDEKGNSAGDVNLSEIHPDLNAFERYDRSTFYIHVPDDFGELKQTEVYSNSDSDYWHLAYIDVTLDGESKIFICYDDIFNVPKIFKPSGYVYKVTTKTSDLFCAGTDEDVILYVYDEKGNPIYCKDANEGDANGYFLDNSENNFEQGDEDVFYIASRKKIGDIKIKCWFSSGAQADWHLEYVQLDLMNDDSVIESTKYKFDQWMLDKGMVGPIRKEVLPVK